MKRIAAVLVLLVVLVVGDRVAEQAVEGVLADQLQGELGSRPDVEIGGVPFLTQAVRGRYDDVQLRADRVERSGVPVLDVRAALTGARVPLSSLLRGEVEQVPVDGLRLRGLVSYDALEAVAGDRDVQLSPEGEDVRVAGSFKVLGREVPVSAVSSLRLDGDSVVLTARRLEIGGASVPGPVAGALSGRLDVRVPLPPLPYDVRVEQVEPGPAGVTVSGAARDTVLRPLS